MNILSIIFIFLVMMFLIVLIRNVLSRKVIFKALKNDVTLLDVRSQEEFAQGTLDGAVNIPVDEIKPRLDGLNFEQHYIVFCSHGIRSLKARSILRKNGFLNVVNGGAKDQLEKNREKLSS